MDQSKKPFLLNSPCYSQISPQALLGKTRSVPTKLFAQRLTCEAVQWYENYTTLKFELTKCTDNV